MMGNESGMLINKPTQDAASLGLMLTLSMPFEMAWAETALSSDRLVGLMFPITPPPSQSFSFHMKIGLIFAEPLLVFHNRLLCLIFNER